MSSSARHSRPSAARLAEFERTWRGKFPGLSVEWTGNRCRMTNPATGISVEVYVFAGSHQPVSDFDESGHDWGAVELRRRYDARRAA